MSDWHCMLSLHGSPKPLSIASTAASAELTGASEPPLPVSASPVVPLVLECAQPIASTSARLPHEGIRLSQGALALRTRGDLLSRLDKSSLIGVTLRNQGRARNGPV